MNQEEIFEKGEADNWFQRNQGVLVGRETGEGDPVFGLLQDFQVKPTRALEIGASNGYRMHSLYKKYGCSVAAIDPSAGAVEDGKKRYPEIDMRVAMAHDLPFKDAEFDLVVVHGVFCWVDRAHLLAALSEADRVLADGGILSVGDFLPPQPERVRYHHLPEEKVYTYKQDYSAVFRASNCYELINQTVFDHRGWVKRPEVEARERFSVTLLRKDLSRNYLTRELP